MTKGITYFCTDSEGNSYTRYSARHNEPLYASAIISRVVGRSAAKSGVSYTAKKLPAFKLLENTFFNGIRQEVARENVQVRAYPGKHSIEPGSVAFKIAL